jgi:hypothetical protein
MANQEPDASNGASVPGVVRGRDERDAGGNMRPRTPVDVDEVLQEVNKAAKRDGRKAFALNRLMKSTNARVIAPQTQAGNRMIQLIEEMDRSLYAMERSASRSFDAALHSAKRDAEDKMMSAAQGLAILAASLASTAGIERKRIIDPMVRARFDELRPAAPSESETQARPAPAELARARRTNERRADPETGVASGKIEADH